MLRMLTALGVREAEQWLWPEVESWDSELQDQSHIWTSLHDRAEYWLELWLSKCKVTKPRSIIIILICQTTFFSLRWRKKIKRS